MENRKILIEWPELNLHAVASLADDKNPELCDDVWNTLPFETIMNNAVVTGNSMYCWTPVVSFAPIHYKELICEAPIGRLRYGQGDGNKLIVQYGPCYDNVKGTVLGAVEPDYLDSLSTVGQKATEAIYITKKKLSVRFSKLDDSHSDAPATQSCQFKNAEAADLYSRISDAALNASEEEPKELVGLRNGAVKGSFGQYFSTWEFVYSFLRDVSMYTLYPVTKFSRNEAVSVQMISDLYQSIMPPYMNYLEEWGCVDLAKYSSEFTALLKNQKIEKYEALQILESLCRYTNMMSSWAYFMFPWGIGAAFRKDDTI